jgi:hypothetical protein
MEWARILAFITGTVDQELLLRNEYLAAFRPRTRCRDGLSTRRKLAPELRWAAATYPAAGS